MGQLPIGECNKCECLSIPAIDKVWTKYCDDCYLEMYGNASTKLCNVCTMLSELPKFRPLVAVHCVTVWGNVYMKNCSECMSDSISHDSRRLLCNKCIESMYNCPPHTCRCGNSLEGG